MRHHTTFRIFVIIAAIGLWFIPVETKAEGTSPASPSPLIKIVKTPSFALPIDCSLGNDCWVMNYVDIGPGDGKKTDPACFSRTYDDHKGTDFALIDGAAMTRGVSALAAMDGTIKRIRDGEPDRWPTDEEIKQVKADRKECGNAILIDHGNGLETIYCHLQKDSIAVKVGQEVKTGDVVAKVGMSGMTQFPHLHFGIIWEGAIVDPFTGQNNTGQCGKKKNSLWKSDLDVNYQPLSIQHAEFSIDVPDFDAIGKKASALPKTSNAPDLLAFWTVLLGVREGDEITIEIRDPNNKIFARNVITQEKTRAQQFYYTGRKLNGRILSEGAYTGSVTITRIGDDDKQQKWNTVRALLVTP